VLVTRPAGSWPALALRFAGSAIAIEMAATTVQVEPLDPSPGERAIQNLASYDWLVVTSGQGVKALTLRLAARGRGDLPAGLRVAAVGAATARALSGTGVAVDLVAEDPHTEGLAAALRPKVVGGGRVLVVRPEGAPGLLAAVLRAAGASVDEAPLYRTVPSEGAGHLAERTIRDAFAGVTFTAPSSLDLWLEAAEARAEALATALARVKRIAIGRTTAAHLADRGLPAHDVAVAPDESAIGDAIARALAGATC
jgi:uroporphyrinogen III methyltransferase/synthase